MLDRSPLISRVLGAAAALVALGAADLQAQRSDADWLESCREGTRMGRHCEARSHRIQLTGRGLNVDAGQNGGVSVRGGDGTDVRFSARVQASAATDEQAREIASRVRIETMGGTVRAVGPENLQGASWSVHFEMQVPRRSDLTLRTQNGPLAVRDVHGTLSLTTQNGPVALRRIGGDVTARLRNGPLSVKLSGDRWVGRGLDAETTNGPVVLELPAGYSAELEVGTRRGPVQMDLLLPRGVRSGQTIRTTLGSGGAPVRVTTTNGPLVVRRGR